MEPMQSPPPKLDASPTAAPATPDNPAPNSPTPKPGQNQASTPIRPTIQDPNQDYIPCRFTPETLMSLHAPQQRLTLSDADSESMKFKVTSAILTSEQSGQITSAFANTIINDIVATDFTGLTSSETIAKVVKLINLAQGEANEPSTTSTKTATSTSFRLPNNDEIKEGVTKSIAGSEKSSQLTPYVSQFSAVLLQQLIANVSTISASRSQVVAQAVTQAAASDKRLNDFAAFQKSITENLLGGVGSNGNNINSILDSARQYLAAHSRPPDVGCAMSILSPREASRAYGYIIGREYIAVQVVIRNLNPTENFVIHDVEFAVNTDPTGTPGRFFSGRDKVIVRALSNAQGSFDPRNIVVNTAQGIGGLFSEIATVFGHSVVPISGIINGGVLPFLEKAWKDESGDQLNLLNDTGFSSAVNQQTVVPKSDKTMVVTFIPSKQFSQGWWVQPCAASYQYITSQLGKNRTKQTSINSYSAVANGQQVGHALEVCSATDKDFEAKKQFWPRLVKDVVAPKYGAEPDPFLVLPASPPIVIDSISVSADKKSATLAIAGTTPFTTADKSRVRITSTEVGGQVISKPYLATISAAAITIDVPDGQEVTICQKDCGTVTLLEEADIFRRAKTVNYWNWSGNSLQLFADLSLVVVSGIHNVEQSDLDLSISQLKCPADTTGDITFGNPPLPASITCTLAGKNLNNAAKLRLRNSQNQADPATVEGTVSVTGDSSNATVTFPAKALRCLAQSSYSVFSVSSTGVETAASQTLHFAPSPYVSSVTSPLDFSKAPSAAQTLTANGCNLSSVETLQLSPSKGVAVGFANSLKPPAADKATFSIDPTKLSDFGTGQAKISLSVLTSSDSSKPVPIDPTIDIIGLSNKVPATGAASSQVTATKLVPEPKAPTAGKPFKFTISGSNFDASTVQVNIVGEGCTSTKPCTISSKDLTVNPAKDLIKGEETLPAGRYKLSVQNGSGGTPHGTLSLVVKAAH